MSFWRRDSIFSNSGVAGLPDRYRLDLHSLRLIALETLSMKPFSSLDRYRMVSRNGGSLEFALLGRILARGRDFTAQRCACTALIEKGRALTKTNELLEHQNPTG